MSFLSKLFGGPKANPMGEANNYLNQIPGIAHEGYDTYIEEGKNAGGKAQGAYDELMNDPTGFINKLMEHYETSKGYNAQKDLLTSELSNTAAAGGVAGTPLDQQNQGTAIQGLLSKDMQQFLENALGVYNRGLGGQETVAQRGYDASGKLTDALGTNLTTQGTLGFQNASQKNSDRNSWFKTLSQALGGGIGLATNPKASIFGHSLWGNK